MPVNIILLSNKASVIKSRVQRDCFFDNEFSEAHFDPAQSALFVGAQHLGSSRDVHYGVLNMPRAKRRPRIRSSTGDQGRPRRGAGCLPPVALSRAVRPGAVHRWRIRSRTGVSAVGQFI